MPPPGGIVKSFVISRPALAYTASSAVLAFFAVTPAPPLIAVSLLIATVRLSAWTFAPRPGAIAKGGLQALAISCAAGLAHLAPGLAATSTPRAAFLVLAALALCASAFAVALVFAGTRFARRGAAPWVRLTLFPALWASGWASMAQVTGLGQLVTWSPVVGLGPYVWMRPVFGQWGVDWVAAAWAVVVSEVLGDWLVGAPDHDGDALVDTEPLLPDVPHAQYGSVADNATPKPATAASRSPAHLALTTLLLLLMLPSYMFSATPLPHLPTDHITEIKVACALPVPRSGNPTLDDYMHATSQLQNAADIILWPESAVRFESPAEREAGFAKIKNMSGVSNKKLIGVSFEEFVPAQRAGESGHRYNGFTLLPINGTPVIEYYKRNLVPLTESFSLTPGTQAPTIFDVELDRPKGVAGPKKRTVPVTVSICLDFASTSSFTPLSSRPALILAPAKTWHPSVGHAMWAQAQARAEETGATVVWCDGGRGGLSGIAGPGYSTVVQVGGGLWSKPLGVPYPFDTRRTAYERGGQLAACAAVWAVVAAGYVVEGGAAAVGVGAAVQALVQRVRRGRDDAPTYGHA
ncbi:hypothetical protein PsYK624_159300 [Phanerochaete sordida]|uniref:CN hydrolase domain-containing protein n=1 Tax=Phanerochaete sordida TaxID=48140 RepID=A0A9P3GSM8_9APHY|nr:hypothetical protein PsYK624_159300 [Phanerochaete sordida]